MVQKSVDHTKAGQFYTYHKDKTDESERKFRVTVDMTSLNIGLENTIKIQLTPPEDIIKNISGKYTTSLDIRQGFFHLEVDEESKRYQAFYCNNRIYTFKRMIQGVKLAPQAFTYVMSLVFSEETMKHVKNQLPSVERNMLPNDFSFVNVYIDDCFIFSESKELHEVHIKATILALIYGGFKLAPNKCTFFADKIKCLGFEVDTSNAEIGIDQIKGSSILEWEKPNNLHVLQSRLFATRYWARFLPNLNEVIYPLTQMLRTGHFEWKQIHDDAWLKLKSLILLDLRLAIPKPEQKLCLFVDASKICVAAVLFIVTEDGYLKPCGCFSKLLSIQEVNRAIYLKEVFAMIEALKYFRHHIINSELPTTVFTDSLSIIYTNRNKHLSSSSNSLTMKLLSLLAEMDIELFNVPGNCNILADLFTRSILKSRYVKGEFSLSKEDAQLLPPLLRNFLLKGEDIKEALLSTLPAESENKNVVFLQKSPNFEEIFEQYKKTTPEDCYFSGYRLLKQWNDESLKNVKLTIPEKMINKVKMNDLKTLNDDINHILTSYAAENVSSKEQKSNERVMNKKIATIQAENIIKSCFPEDLSKKVATRIKNSFVDNIMRQHMKNEKTMVNSMKYDFITIEDKIPIQYRTFFVENDFKHPTVLNKENICIYMPEDVSIHAKSIMQINLQISLHNPHNEIIMDPNLAQGLSNIMLVKVPRLSTGKPIFLEICNTSTSDIHLKKNTPILVINVSTRLNPKIQRVDKLNELLKVNNLLYGQIDQHSDEMPNKKI